MRLTVSVEHVDASGSGTLCAEPSSISVQELAAIKSDVFRWLDGPDLGPRLNGLKANQVVVMDAVEGVLFSAYRV